MKNILCYGDSNTFGFTLHGGRHPYDVRWTGRLQLALGPAYRVIEEGCGGRTTVFEDPIDLGRNGRTSLPVCLASHNPLDLVILMLGTNDMKHYFQNNAWSIGQGVAQLLHLIQTYPYAPNYSAPKVLVVSPIHIGPDVAHSPFGSFQPEAIEISKGLAAEIRRAAEQAGCAFFDAAAVAGPCDEDSIHMDAANHAALARALHVPQPGNGKTLCAAGLAAFALCLCWQLPYVLVLMSGLSWATPAVWPEIFAGLGLCCVGGIGGACAAACLNGES